MSEKAAVSLMPKKKAMESRSSLRKMSSNPLRVPSCRITEE